MFPPVYPMGVGLSSEKGMNWPTRKGGARLGPGYEQCWRRTTRKVVGGGRGHCWASLSSKLHVCWQRTGELVAALRRPSCEHRHKLCQEVQR
jgi:hypothetical protein